MTKYFKVVVENEKYYCKMNDFSNDNFLHTVIAYLQENNVDENVFCNVLLFYMDKNKKVKLND